jgi:3-hydroxybutyrate dehydrogenase
MLKGKTAIVTGSTSGIGLGIARALAGQGANILLNGFGDAADIEKLRVALGSEYGVRVAYSAADMSKPDEIAGMVAQSVRDLGSVDILVNNAGIQHTAPVQNAAYVAAKHGILGITKVVALETAETGVTCNAICPGWVLTPLVQKQIDDLAKRESLTPSAAKMKLLGEKQPSMEFVTPEEIGATAVFLCSDAAAQIRGIGLPVDGGWTAQ